jgi:acetyl-CoA carboxylase biotin carboxyl carrier protein
VPLTAQDVAEITRLLEESEFDELHIESDGFKLTLRRGARGTRTAAPLTTAAVESASEAAARPAHAPASERAAAAVAGSIVAVPAPLLGTFYRAPKPGAPPYVEVGSEVRENTIVGIIEVMKLMNTVRAGVGGRIIEILAQDGALVEYGQVLLRVLPGPQA